MVPLICDLKKESSGTFLAFRFRSCPVEIGRLLMRKDFQTWRAYLARLISQQEEGKRIALAMEVDTYTLQRWAADRGFPNTLQIRRLLDCIREDQRLTLAQLLAEDGMTTLPYGCLRHEKEHISTEFYQNLLQHYIRLSMTSTDRMRGLMVLFHQVMQHFDPKEHGMQVSLLTCMPPQQDGLIHSLRRSLSLRNSGWPLPIPGYLEFTGINSPAGYAVQYGVPIHVAGVTFFNIKDKPQRTGSMLIMPVHRAAGTLGALVLSSLRSRYPEELFDLAIQYSELSALFFEDEDFRPKRLLDLRPIPTYGEQYAFFTQEQSIIVDKVNEQERCTGSPVYPTELEVWGEIERRILEGRQDEEQSDRS